MSDFKFHKNKWLTQEDKKVYETPIFDLYKKRMTPGPDEAAGDFYVIDAPEWVNVIALTPERRIVLVEQYRHGVDEVTLEIPGGMVDEGELPEKSARRELLEETGFTSNDWRSLGKVSSNPAILSNFTHFFVAEDCRKTSGQQPGQFEDISVHLVDLNLFFDYVRSNRIHHSIVIAAVAKFLLSEEVR